MATTEEWRDVVGYEGLYRVSNLGRVYSEKYKKILVNSKQRNGYLSVELWKDKTNKRVLVHRLVALAFIPNESGLPQVNHKDEDKTNNCVENLEWCTSKYNMNYGEMAKIRHTLIDYTTENRKDIARKNGKAVSRAVVQMDVDGNVIAEYPSGKEAHRMTGVDHSHLLDVCKGKYRTAGGYMWKYKEDD